MMKKKSDCEMCICGDSGFECEKSCDVQCEFGQVLVKPLDDQCCYCEDRCIEDVIIFSLKFSENFRRY